METKQMSVSLKPYTSIDMMTNLIKNIMLLNTSICNYPYIYILTYELHISLYMKIKA